MVIITVLYEELRRSILHPRDEIYRDRSRKLFGLTQSTYIGALLKWFNIDNFKKDYLSISHGITPSKKDCLTTLEERDCMSRILYASTVGSIIYAVTCMRSDVAYSLGIVSRYQSDLGEKHWTIAKVILKYLRNTKD